MKLINLGKKQAGLLATAPLLCVSMLILVPLLTAVTGKTAGYVIGFCVYWFLFCLPASVYSANGFRGLKEIYTQKSDISSAMRNICYLLSIIPCTATFFAVFKKFAPAAGLQVLVVALVFALINGIFEEMFWRGAFNKVFSNNIIFAYIYPSIFFGIWHIALYFAKGMVYQGGFFSLVGGSFFMGLLWGWAAYKTGSIKFVTAAHILTNFFAFTGLISENWLR